MQRAISTSYTFLYDDDFDTENGMNLPSTIRTRKGKKNTKGKKKKKISRRRDASGDPEWWSSSSSESSSDIDAEDDRDSDIKYDENGIHVNNNTSS
jgi:hypothetical protein